MVRFTSSKHDVRARESLIREWLCGRIGHALGLPIPPFAMVFLDPAVAKYSVYEEAAALADCPGFGSHFIELADELTMANTGLIDPHLRLEILVFDWWSINGYRTDDNPNLLWQPHNRSLHVIDHNLAFGEDEPKEFWARHIFRDDRHRLSDTHFQATMLSRMGAIIEGRLPALWSELPEAWTESSSLTFERVDSVLRRSLIDAFWRVP